VHVHSKGVRYNGVVDVTSGSGLLISDSYVLTNKHLVFAPENYAQITTEVRVGNLKAEPLIVSKSLADTTRDLAMIELAKPVTSASVRASCPIAIETEPKKIPPGSTLYVLGFPLDKNLSIVSGLLSNQDGGNGRWQTDSALNRGNSGGPVFDGNGSWVGIVVSGVAKWQSGTEIVDVDGVNFFLPLAELLASELNATINAIADDQRCWIRETLDRAKFIADGQRKVTELARAFTVAKTKDDHPVVFGSSSRNYSESFAAEPGFKISGCAFNAQSANNADDVVCRVTPEGAGATIDFRLTSGPAVDRWRGWLQGTVTLQQEKIVP